MLEAEFETDRREFTVALALSIAAGERLALFGPSGSGKTTTLETLAGLVAPRTGRVTLAGRVLTQTPRRAVPPWQRGVGLLRQDPGLFPHLTVGQNLGYGAGAHPDRERVGRIAAQLGIGGLLDRRPGEVSGGQAHRVALGRLLLARCEALLLDEPYTGLDAVLRRDLTDLVRAVVAERAVPAILVAHELAQAQAFADRLAVIDRGRLLQSGPPDEVVRRPASRRVAELVGYQGFVAGAGPGTVMGVHPERVVAGHSDRGPVLTGKLTACRPAGAGWEAELATAGETIRCLLPERPPGDGGELVITLLDPPVFGPDGVLLPRPDQVRA
ncbi:MAG TPA: ABC transporter ATP-binding protein [Streptosporangiaceae bacterium]